MFTAVQRSPHGFSTLLACLILASFLVLSHTHAQESIQPEVVAQIENGAITALLSDDQVKDLLQDEAAFLDVGATIDEVRFEKNNNLYYSVGKGQTEAGNCFSVAKELVVSNGTDIISPVALLTFGTTTHFCDGSPCSSCRFVEEASTGVILGCECSDSEANRYCNHSVVTTEP